MSGFRRALSRAIGLRARLSIGMLAITFASCLGFALAIHEFVSVLRDELLYQTLDRELSSLVVDYRHGVPIAGPRGASGQVFVSHHPARPTAIPRALAGLGNGGHAVIRYHGGQYYAARRDVNGTAIYMLLDAATVEHLEDRLAAIGWSTLGLTVALALLMAVFFSYLILRPVRGLADRLAHYRPGQSNPPIAADYGDRDMRDIAESFDALIARFDAVLDRQQAFTEDASHELRTPLAVALNASELLEAMPDLGERAGARVARVRHACERMHRIVTALLFLARDQSGEPSGQCDAAVVLDDVLLYQRDVVTAHRIHLIIDAEPTPLPVPAGVLDCVLHNLIDNAMRHTVDGEVRISVSPSRIAVCDSGAGLPEEALAHIFQRQYRTANSPGLGIGLYLVSRICDRQGWSISAASRPQAGTRIEIRLDAGPEP